MIFNPHATHAAALEKIGELGRETALHGAIRHANESASSHPRQHPVAFLGLTIRTS